MRRVLVPLLIGVIGTAILVSLGSWQLRRLAWKEEILARIEARIDAPPAEIPAAPTEEADEYLSIRVTGTGTGAPLYVLTSIPRVGPGYRVIQPIDTGARRILLDRGFVRDTDAPALAAPASVDLPANLLWPNETDGFTPPPEDTLWFARDLPAMAETLDTEPVLAVARTADDPLLTPLPVTTEGIANDHREYALTWFGLALVWAGMTALWIWRITRRIDE